MRVHLALGVATTTDMDERYKNVRLVGVFGVFVLLVFGYALVYYLMYLDDETSFFINSDIAAQQQRQMGASVQARLELLTRRQQLLKRLNHELASGRLPHVGARNRIDQHILTAVLDTHVAYYEFALSVPLVSPPDAVDRHPTEPRPMLTIYNSPAGKELGHWVSNRGGLLEGTLQNYRVLTREFAALVGRQLEAARHEGVQLAAGEHVWSYLDFLYFSAITAWTVGYGDILPNRTAVRLVVVSQVLASAFIAVVLINVAWKGRKAAAPRNGGFA